MPDEAPRMRRNDFEPSGATQPRRRAPFTSRREITGARDGASRGEAGDLEPPDVVAHHGGPRVRRLPLDLHVVEGQAVHVPAVEGVRGKDTDMVHSG